jgi:ribosomal subunit interface protein
MLTVNIRSNGIEVTDALREHIERTVASSLDRFVRRLKSVSLFLVDLNGPRGGVSRLCQMTAQFKSGHVVSILQKDSDIEPAIKRAAGRLKFAVSRTLNRAKRPIRVLSGASVRSNAAIETV